MRSSTLEWREEKCDFVELNGAKIIDFVSTFGRSSF